MMTIEKRNAEKLNFIPIAFGVFGKSLSTPEIY